MTDAQYWAIPKGVAPDQLAVLLDLTKYMLGKPAQAMTYDKGYFYPGPAVKDVPLSMAPADSQKLIAEYSRSILPQAVRRRAVGSAAAARTSWSTRSSAGTSRSAREEEVNSGATTRDSGGLVPATHFRAARQVVAGVAGEERSANWLAPHATSASFGSIG